MSNLRAEIDRIDAELKETQRDLAVADQHLVEADERIQLRERQIEAILAELVEEGSFEWTNMSDLGQLAQDAAAVMTARATKAEAQLEKCRGWFQQIKRHWKRWDDLRTLSGKPSTTQEIDAWLAASQPGTEAKQDG